jgi:cold shock CspA family protein
MLTGTIKKLVHLSQQTHLRSSVLVSGHNEHGYGVIEDAEGRDVYFAHEAVTGGYGFDDLRPGQRVEYTLETAPYLRAAWVGAAPTGEASVLGPAA